MKYKEGDKVRIVSEEPEKNWSFLFMNKWLDKIMTIDVVHEDGYNMVEDNGEWYWQDHMIARLAEINAGI